MPFLQRALIKILATQGDNPTEVEKTIKLQFNPQTLTIRVAEAKQEKATSVLDSEGKQSTTSNYDTTNSIKSPDVTISGLELFFDVFGEMKSDQQVDVRKYTYPIIEMMHPVDDGKIKKCKFQWGVQSYVGMLTSATQELLMFDNDGVPTRAKLTIDIVLDDPNFLKSMPSDIVLQGDDDEAGKVEREDRFKKIGGIDPADLEQYRKDLKELAEETNCYNPRIPIALRIPYLKKTPAGQLLMNAAKK